MAHEKSPHITERRTCKLPRRLNGQSRLRVEKNCFQQPTASNVLVALGLQLRMAARCSSKAEASISHICDVSFRRLCSQSLVWEGTGRRGWKTPSSVIDYSLQPFPARRSRTKGLRDARATYIADVSIMGHGQEFDPDEFTQKMLCTGTVLLTESCRSPLCIFGLQSGSRARSLYWKPRSVQVCKRPRSVIRLSRGC